MKTNFIIRNTIDSKRKAYDTEWFDSLMGKIENLHRYLYEEKGEHNDTSQCISSYVASELKMLKNKRLGWINIV